VIRCNHCLRTAGHTRWCPELDIDIALAGRTARDAYALGLLHASLQPSAGMVERALVALTPAELARLAQRIARPRPEIAVTARPSEHAPADEP